MESKSALFAKGTALRAQLEARGIEVIDIPCSTKHIEWARQNTETIDEYTKEQDQ
jgi:short-subunit dehydrogenase involved in D-alanine esterification of teichoic acids